MKSSNRLKPEAINITKTNWNNLEFTKDNFKELPIDISLSSSSEQIFRIDRKNETSEFWIFSPAPDYDHKVLIKMLRQKQSTSNLPKSQETELNHSIQIKNSNKNLLKSLIFLQQRNKEKATEALIKVTSTQPQNSATTKIQELINKIQN